jgi:hypothetical protein
MSQSGNQEYYLVLLAVLEQVPGGLVKMSFYVRASIVIDKTINNIRSPYETAICKSHYQGWRAPTVALKNTEKQICTPTPPVHCNPPTVTVNVTFKSG